MGYRNVIASPLKPLELAGGYPFLNASLAVLQPGGNDRDTRVEIRRLAPEPAPGPKPGDYAAV